MKIAFNLFATLFLCLIFSACPPTCEFKYLVDVYQCDRYVTVLDEERYCKGSGYYQEILHGDSDHVPNPVGGCQFEINGIHNLVSLGVKEKCQN